MCCSHLDGEQPKMTDMERDEIDAGAELYIKTCRSAIQELRSQGIAAVTGLLQL